MNRENEIRKAVLVAVAKRYQKFNNKNPTGQEILDRALVRYDPVSDEFHPNDIDWIDSQQVYYKLDDDKLVIDPAAFDELCGPQRQVPAPIQQLHPSTEIMANAKARVNGSPIVVTPPTKTKDEYTISSDDRDLLELHLSKIETILSRID